MGFLAGKRFLITGVLSNRSIAYGIARACRREGAELAFSYQGERFKERVAGFASEFGSTLIYDCDVADDAQIEALFTALGEAWPTFDGFVHSIGYAPKEAIAGDFLEGLSREAFKIAHDISSYSFPGARQGARPRLSPTAGPPHPHLPRCERSVPNYNTMGLGQGVARGLGALPRDQPRPARHPRQRHLGRADQDARRVGHQGLRPDPRRVERNAPLRRNVTIDDVGNVAAFLLSDLAAGVTSEITYVDAGFSHAMGGIA
jgi:enoyl-[acyl-carrier protein] reductase I